MDDRQSALMTRLDAFTIGDAGAALDFTRRLARENGWSIAFAHRVVSEYKRFVFLAMEAGHPVTPSDEVDQAWHLHLAYTRSYWDELCGQVLGRPLHHGPTRGGKAEDLKFEQWYGETLASYHRLFGEAPPRDIWPLSAVRFGLAPHFRRVNTRDVWLVPRFDFRRATAWGATMGVCGAALVGCGLIVTAGQNGMDVLWFALAIFAIGALIGVVVWLARKGGGSGSGCGATGCAAASGCGGDGGGSGGGGGCGGGGD